MWIMTWQALSVGPYRARALCARCSRLPPAALALVTLLRVAVVPLRITVVLLRIGVGGGEASSYHRPQGTDG